MLVFPKLKTENTQNAKMRNCGCEIVEKSKVFGELKFFKTR